MSHDVRALTEMVKAEKRLRDELLHGGQQGDSGPGGHG